MCQQSELCTLRKQLEEFARCLQSEQCTLRKQLGGFAKCQQSEHTVLSGSSFILVNRKVHVYLPNFQCLKAGLYFQVYRHFLRLFAGFNTYVQYLLFVFIFQFIFLCTESFRSIYGKILVGRAQWAVAQWIKWGCQVWEAASSNSG